MNFPFLEWETSNQTRNHIRMERKKKKQAEYTKQFKFYLSLFSIFYYYFFYLLLWYLLKYVRKDYVFFFFLGTLFC